jgi:hypothetical protein
MGEYWFFKRIWFYAIPLKILVKGQHKFFVSRVYSGSHMTFL